MMLLVVILLIVFLANFLIYWLLFLKTKGGKSKFWNIYTKIYLIAWITPVLLIPLISSSLLGALSYFHDLWIWFLLLGVVFAILGAKILRNATLINKIRGLEKGNYKLVTEGIYKVMRHPMYSGWALIFIGLAFIFDSFIALILIPFFVLFLGFETVLEEKYLLSPKFGKNYVKYKEETQSRFFPSPYNIFLILTAIFVLYVGFFNFFVYA